MKPRLFTQILTLATTDLLPFIKDLGSGTWGERQIPITNLASELDRLINAQTTLTYAATTDIDLTVVGIRTLALTGNVTFTTSNRAAGRRASLKIAADSSTRTFTFPAGWVFVGAAAPANIAANKVARLTLECYGTADTDIIAAYAVQP